MKEDITNKQWDILKTLLEAGEYLSTTEISNKAKCSWNTAFKHLKLFQSYNWIYHITQGNRDYWKAEAEE